MTTKMLPMIMSVMPTMALMSAMAVVLALERQDSSRHSTLAQRTENTNSTEITNQYADGHYTLGP